MRVTVRDKLVVGFGELIPMESGYYDSAYQYTATFTKDNEEPVTNLNRTLWCKQYNWTRLKKSLERLMNPTVYGVCAKGGLELVKDNIP